MTYTVIISATAEADPLAIFDYIAERAGPRIASRFVDRIEDYCNGFATVPDRGTNRDDLRPGCERSVSSVGRRSCSRSITDHAALSFTASITVGAVSSAISPRTTPPTTAIDR
jgi:plasmid stabilization system protein ParE